MTLVFYISGHGFGHATRSFTVIDQLHRLNPALRIIVRSSVPDWFLQQSLESPVERIETATDTGMAQIDSLRIDEDETVRRAAAFYRTFDARVDHEARALVEARATIVVGDIPPLAFAAARHAGVPSIACANFTWDWIYAHYPAFAAAAPGVVDLIRGAYAGAALALRLPFHGGFASMQTVTRDVPLIARRSRLGRTLTRQRLGLDVERPIVLASFGGYGAALPFRSVAEQARFTLLLTSHEAPDRDAGDRDLRVVTSHELTARELRYEDLVAAADVVVSKPGYGIVSECIANETALLYTSRGNFIEHDVLVTGMSRVLRTEFISQDDLQAGRWANAVEGLLGQASAPESMPINGAEVVARLILDCSERGA